ncbi:TonB-dependent receptor [Kangiella taiwanensis]|uniref:TonB-dependent receptor n=1 Tax=Kangiella taiwanensis TaxID=1079179 RepID=A0ABP8I5N5_9GAMM|nr:TonB-dependent receptor [Kangiella taiwanensis]
MTQTSLATQRFVAIAVTATLSLSATVKAAEQSDSQEGVYDDNTVVIIASRFKERNARLPTNITIISKDDIERSNATQVVQLLKRVAGVQVSSVSGKTTVSMRGISAEQAGNNVLIQVDGRRLNYTDIAAPDLESVLVSDIERIEIIQGAASTLYGDQAVAGVINIVTRSGNSKESNASLIAGNFGTVQGNVNLNHTLNQDWSFLLSANYLETDNYRDHNERDQSQLAVKFNYLTDTSDWLFEANTNREDLETPGALLDFDLSEPIQSRPEFANDYVDSQQDVLRVFGQETIDENWQYALDVNYLDSDIESINSFVGFPTTTVNTTDRTQWSIYPRIKGEWQAGSGSIDWINGIDYDHAEYDFSLLGRSNEQVVKSLYSQLFIPLSKRTDIELAARYARVEDDLVDLTAYPSGIRLKNSATAYDLGLSHQFSEDSKGYARYSNNYRFAKVDEQSYTAEGVVGLEPQTGDSFEVGYEQSFEHGYLKLSAYQLVLDDEIFFDPAATPPAGAFFPGANVNGGESERLGLIVDYQTELSEELTAGANYHFVDADIKRGESGTAGNRIPGVSEHTVNAWFDWQIDSISNWYIEANYRSDRYQEGDVANAQPKVGSHVVLNSAVNWQWEQVTLGIRVDNLLDKEYIDYAQFGGYYPANGRYGYVKLSYRF